MAKTSKKIIEEDEIEGADSTYTEDDGNVLPPSDIIAYNELRSCADLYRMYKDKILDISPDFQRAEVWSEAQKTRFVDSLIKKLPIPSMCFSLDYKTEKWQVIDGLQRITSIIKFLDDSFDWRLSTLDDIDGKLSGKYVSEIKKVEKGLLYTRLENLTIPVTVLRCDYKKKNHSNYLFTIFHRLNTGGVKLTNQEIRNAIYNGPFNSLLKECNSMIKWRKILALKDNKTYRLSKEELILRFFTFYYELDSYEGKLSKYLNDYMSDNRDQNDSWLTERRELFKDTIEIIYEKISDKKSIGKLSNVYVEALLLGVGKNIDYLKKKNSSTLKGFYSKLQNNEYFSKENLREDLASKNKVINRLNAAKKIFSGK